jgi:4-amino-4-deoxy-L-arabinose transferase-like glycosyltransferase
MSLDPIDSQAPGRYGRLAVLGLLALLALLFFYRLGQDVPLRTHESLLAETARNMVLDHPVERPDGSRPSPYLVPNFNGSDRLKKTPLPYWTVAGLARLTGGVDEWTARLPSAIAAFLTVVVLMLLLRRQVDLLTALLGAAALATSFGFLIASRQALADMSLTLYMAVCLAALWMGVERQGPRRFAWLVLAGVAGGLAMMAKGPVPLVVVPGPVLVAAVVMVLRLRRQSREGRPTGAEWAWTLGGALLAMALFVGILLPWLATVPGAWGTLWSESVDRSVGELGHKKPESIFFYVLRLPFLVAPWTIFFGWGLVLAVRQWFRQKTERAWLAFVGAWFLGTLAAISLAEGKQDHYILAAFPAIAVFTAMAMRQLLGPADPVTAKTGRRLIFAHAVIGLVAAVAGLAIAAWLTWHTGRAPKFLESMVLVGPAALAVICGIAAIGCATSCLLALRRRLVGSLMALAATLVLALLAAWPTMVGPMDRATTAAAFGREVRARVPADAAVYVYHDANATVLFYAGRDLPSLNTPEEVESTVAGNEHVWLIVPDKFKTELAAVGSAPNVLKEVWHVSDPFHPDEGYALMHGVLDTSPHYALIP